MISKFGIGATSVTSKPASISIKSFEVGMAGIGTTGSKSCADGLGCGDNCSNEIGDEFANHPNQYDNGGGESDSDTVDWWDIRVWFGYL